MTWGLALQLPPPHHWCHLPRWSSTFRSWWTSGSSNSWQNSARGKGGGPDPAATGLGAVAGILGVENLASEGRESPAMRGMHSTVCRCVFYIIVAGMSSRWSGLCLIVLTIPRSANSYSFRARRRESHGRQMSEPRLERQTCLGFAFFALGGHII